MEKKYFFIAGFPRSGSTLLAGILKQNPDFHASMTTLLAQMLCEVQYISKDQNTVLPLSNNQTMSMFEGCIDGFYRSINKKVIFDCHRMWPRFDGILKRLFPYTKIICCVRDIPSILNSFEYYYKFKSVNAPTFVSPEAALNPWVRMDEYYEYMVRRPYESCYYSYFSPVLSKMYHFVDYDDLVNDPKKIIKELYSVLGLKYFSHNFDEVHINFDEFDLKNPGLHVVAGKIQKTSTEWVIPKDVSDKYNKPTFWK